MPSLVGSEMCIRDRSSSKCRNTPSTNQLHVFSFQVGRSVLMNKDYCLHNSSSSKIFGQGGNAWNLLDFDDQSAAIVCVGSIKYYSIPSVPSRLEGVKTRPLRGGAHGCFQDLEICQNKFKFAHGGGRKKMAWTCVRFFTIFHDKLEASCGRPQCVLPPFALSLIHI